VVGEVTETCESRTYSHDGGVSPPRRWSLAEIIALACILAVAAFVRFHRIGGHSFWLDELFTVQAVNGTGLAGTYELPRDTILDPAPQPSAMRPLHPWWRILRPDVHDIHPPLFYLLTRGWVTLFGYTEAGFRSHAAVWSLAAVLLLHLTLRIRTGVVVGLFAAAIMALAQPQIQLAQNARSYPMIEALVLFACLLITVIEKRGLTTARCWTLTFILLAAMLTHYSSIGAVAALGLYALLCLRDCQRRAVIAACIAASVAFALIWGRAAWLQSSGESAREPVRFLDSSEHHVRATLLRFASLPAEFLNEAPPGWKWLAPASLLLLPLSLLQRPHRRRDALFWILVFAGGTLPVLCADLARRSTRLELPWYSILGAPAVYALLAAVTASLRSAMRYWLPAIAALSCAIAVPNAYLHGWRPDWRRIGHTAAAYAHDGDLLIVIPTLDFDPMHPAHFTLCAAHYAQPLRGPLLVRSAPATPELWSKLASYPGVVVITDNASADGLLNNVQPRAMRIFPLEGQVYRFVPPASWKSQNPVSSSSEQ
jgi:4-amino-4-deoxy-L-arabinose transferase-like glycosyltransferase